MMKSYLTECLWYLVFLIALFWAFCVSYASGIVIKEQWNKEIKENYTLTYHNNRIYIDGNKTEYTLKEVSEGVYVIREGE